MSVTGSRRLLTVVASIAFSLAAGSVQAQTRSETLRYVTGASVNTLDPNIPGSTREAFAVSLSTYDRLVSFGRKQLNGKWVFDLGKITGELAESYEVSPDGLKMTFRLRKDAKFHDGTPLDGALWLALVKVGVGAAVLLPLSTLALTFAIGKSGQRGTIIEY